MPNPKEPLLKEGVGYSSLLLLDTNIQESEYE